MLSRNVRPEELSLEQIERVLEFLNRAGTAAEIAARVEFAGERDVGVGVGKRLLTRRSELGGKFTTIQQVAQVPQVGPERFTEIVLAITGFIPSASAVAALERELQALRSQIAALGALVVPLGVELEPLVTRHYLGQKVSLRARVTRGPERAPVPGAAVTLVTTFGELESYDSFGLRRGLSLALTTDVDGVAYATLSPLTDEPCRLDQKAALEALIDDLPADAATPEKALTALDAMVTRYRHTESSVLRGAIDIYFRTFADGRLEPVNAYEPLLAWPLVDASVLAFARAEGNHPSAVEATAILDHPFRNWLFAWLSRFSARVEEESSLGGSIGGLFERGKDPGYILGAAYDRIRHFVEGERGVVGELFGRRVVEETLRQLTATGLEKVPEDVRLFVRQGIGVASSSVGSKEGLRLLNSFDRTQDLSRRENRGLNLEFDGKLSGFDGKLELLGGKLSVFDGKLSGLDTKLAGFDTKLADFDTKLDGFDGKFGELGGKLLELDGKLDVFDGKLNVALPELETKLRQGNIALRDEVQGALTNLNGKVAAVENKVDAKVDQNVFANYQRGLDANVAVLNRDVGLLKRR